MRCCQRTVTPTVRAVDLLHVHKCALSQERCVVRSLPEGACVGIEGKDAQDRNRKQISVFNLSN